MGPAISIRGLTKAYGDVRALGQLRHGDERGGVYWLLGTERRRNRHGRLRAVLAYEEGSEAPSLAFLDADGQTRVIVRISWNQMPQIQLAAPDGAARVALVVRPDGMGIVVIMDKQQRSKTMTPTDT